MNEISICFVVLYFGHLPSYFQMWLNSCKYNPTINWILFIDDDTCYEYPENVKVVYLSFKEMQSFIQRKYDFHINLKTPYKLCDYKVAYGDIFHEYLKDFDFWGYCDIDLLWGNIRRFYTSEMLQKYEKIGNQGHATIYRNNPEVNLRYRLAIEDESYNDDFITDEICCTDVQLIRKIYEKYQFRSFTDTVYAGLEKYEAGFFLQGKEKCEAWKNKFNLFLWEKGKLSRYYINASSDLFQEEYLYIHFFCRPMKLWVDSFDRFLIYPDVIKSFDGEITSDLVKKYGKKNKLAYYYRVYMQNRDRISIKKTLSYFKIKKKYEKQKNK